MCTIDREHSSGNELTVQTLRGGWHLNEPVCIPLSKHSKQALPCHYPRYGETIAACQTTCQTVCGSDLWFQIGCVLLSKGEYVRRVCSENDVLHYPVFTIV